MKSFLLGLLALAGCCVAANIDKRIVEDALKPKVTEEVELPHNEKIDYPHCGHRYNIDNNGVHEINDWTPRIVGGAPAQKDTWPFICSMRTRSSPSFHFCGGNLIRNKQGEWFFLTAAHCLDANRSPSYYNAVCGIYDRSDDRDATRIQFSHMKIHEQYDVEFIANDIALLKISTNLNNGTDKIQHVCLSTKAYSGDEKVIAAGWGTTDSGYSPYALHQVNKLTKPMDVCKKRYGDRYILPGMMCAGLPTGGSDSCQGDSGGPLYGYRAGVWDIAGITSWGYGCGVAGFPGVYADVDWYRKWIHANINLGGIYDP